MAGIVDINKLGFAQKDYLSSGVEGTILKVDVDLLAKIYPNPCAPAQVIKLVSLLRNYDRLTNYYEIDFAALPLALVYMPSETSNGSNAQIAGFEMKYFDNSLAVGDIIYELDNGVYKNLILNDDDAFFFVDSLFIYLMRLHCANIYIGDIHLDNILIDKSSFLPIFVDIDSAQYRTAKCSVRVHPSYCHPSLTDINLLNHQFQAQITKEHDIYALTILVFEFLIGISPFDIGTSWGLTVEDLKRQNINYVTYNLGKGLSGKNMTIVDFERLNLVLFRLNEVKSKFSELYDFFVKVIHYRNINYPVWV